MPRVRVLLASLLGGVVALHACKVYDESLLEPSDGKPVSPDLWGSGVGWWSRVRPNGCVTAGVPTPDDRPKNTASGELAPLVFAVRSMALGSLDRNGDATPGAWKQLGFDLDGLCTNSGTCETSDLAFPCEPQAAMVGDGDYCRDNTFGKLEQDTIAVEDLGKTFGLSNDAFNCALCRGDYNFVFQVSGWNGEPNDSNVRVDIYPSPGIEVQTATWQCELNAPIGSWKQNGCWTSADKFTIQTNSYVGSLDGGKLPEGQLNDPSAYVREGYVVAQLPENTLFWFPGKSAAWAYPLKLQRGIVVGKLVKTADTYRLEDGTIAGRARSTDLVSAFEDLGLCAGHPLYSLLTTNVALSADVLWNGTNTEEASCDAISVGIGFDAEQAGFSTTPRDPVPLPGCLSSDAGSDAGDAGASEGGSDSGSDAAAQDAGAG